MGQFNLREKQIEINRIDYWDVRILDLQILFFGDEVHLYIEDYDLDKHNLEECWKITFNGCSKLNYETDARERRNFKVKDFTKNQLYTCQDISLDYYDEIFTKCTIVLESLVLLNFICKTIDIEKVSISKQEFFWSNNF